MKRPNKKQIEKFRPIYEFYSKSGDINTLEICLSKFRQDTLGVQFVFDENGLNGIQAAWIFETYGRRVVKATSDPINFIRFITGKAWTGVNIENWANSLVEGTLLLWEFAEWEIPESFYNDTMKSAGKLFLQRDGYCPRCYTMTRNEYLKIWNEK